jgi:hypothetical protein
MIITYLTLCVCSFFYIIKHRFNNIEEFYMHLHTSIATVISEKETKIDEKNFAKVLSICCFLFIILSPFMLLIKQ